jgi:tetratricopeptide (TPR) repeat protein
MIKSFIKFLLFFTLAPFLLTATDPQDEPPELPEFDQLWDYSDPAKTEQTFVEIYAKFKESAAPSYLAQLLSQIARTQGLQGKFDLGFKTIQEAADICPEEDQLAKVRILLETGRLHNSSGQKERAREYFLEAKDLALNEALDLYAIDAIHMLGIVDPPEQQLKWNLLAIELTEKTEDKRAKGWLGPLLNNTGWSYFDKGDYEAAMILFEKSLKWREEIQDDIGIRIAKWTIARTLRAQLKYEKALEIQLQLEQEISAKELPPDGYVFEELGELYLWQEDKEKAKYYFGLAYPLLSADTWLLQNEPERLNRIKQLME